MVYGSYCAVALADARALQALRSSLGELLEERDWHKGGYEAQVRGGIGGGGVGGRDWRKRRDVEGSCWRRGTSGGGVQGGGQGGEGLSQGGN